MISKEDLDLWKTVTNGIKPLDGSPVSPVQGLPNIKVAEPRTISYDPRVDLHGLTVHQAYQLVLKHIADGNAEGYKKLIVVTGRSGQINLELPRWLEKNPFIRSVEQMRNGGSWQINLKRGT